MTQPLTDDMDAPRLTRAVRWLIALNIAVFFVQLTTVGTANMQQWLGYLFEKELAAGWWTVFTYPFVHGSFWHLAIGAYTLYLFGPRLERAWSAGELTRYYVLCGLGGWLFHLLFAREALLVGATAPVLGVALAHAMRWPDDEVALFGVLPLRVRSLMALMVAANLVVGMVAAGEGAGISYLAHIGGLITGWLYLRSSAGPSLERLRQRVSPLPDMPDEPPRAVPRSLPRSREREREIDDIVAQSNAALRRRPASSAPPVASRPAPARTDLNAVLDKISEHGMESLTIEERKLLEEKSRELRREDS